MKRSKFSEEQIAYAGDRIPSTLIIQTELARRFLIVTRPVTPPAVYSSRPPAWRDFCGVFGPYVLRYGDGMEEALPKPYGQ
jgi:hypothetical protein